MNILACCILWVILCAAILEAVTVTISRSQSPVDKVDVVEFGEHTTSMIPTFDSHNENVFYLIAAEAHYGSSRALTRCFISPVYVSCNEICNISTPAGFMDMVVLDSLIVFLTSYNGIVLYDKPTGMKDSCLFKPSGFSVYGTEKKHIENVKIFPYSSVEFFASWTDTKRDKVVVALLNAETSSHIYLSHTYLSHNNPKPLSALTLSNCDQYTLVTAQYNSNTEEICVQFSKLNAKHSFDGAKRFCLPLTESDVEGIPELSVSCNNILYLIVTHKRLGNVLYKWDWPTITDLTEELKVTNANPPLVGSKSKLLFHNDKGNIMLVDSDKSSKGQGTSAENSQQPSLSDRPAASHTVPGLADTATSPAAPKAAPEAAQPDTCSKGAGNLLTTVNQMQMKRYRFKISSFCRRKYYEYREAGRPQLAPGETARECAVECAFAHQQTQCVGFAFNSAEGSCNLLTWAESRTSLSYHDYRDENYVCYERIYN